MMNPKELVDEVLHWDPALLGVIVGLSLAVVVSVAVALTTSPDPGPNSQNFYLSQTNRHPGMNAWFAIKSPVTNICYEVLNTETGAISLGTLSGEFCTDLERE